MVTLPYGHDTAWPKEELDGLMVNLLLCIPEIVPGYSGVNRLIVNCMAHGSSVFQSSTFSSYHGNDPL